MRAGRLPDPRRARDHDGAEDIHAMLAGLLETRLQTALPVRQPLLQPLHLALVAANLLQSLRRVSVGPQLIGGCRLRTLLASLLLSSLHLLCTLKNGLLLLLDLLARLLVQATLVGDASGDEIEEAYTDGGVEFIISYFECVSLIWRASY